MDSCEHCGDVSNGPYAVVAHRWGLRDAHSYVVSVHVDVKDAMASADQCVEDRGGKYGCEVCDSAGRQVYYINSPYFGCAGRFRAACDPADRSMPTAERLEFACYDSFWRSLWRQIKHECAMWSLRRKSRSDI